MGPSSQSGRQAYSIVGTLMDRRFWMFFGSGLIVSVAYMDPGNWGTNISGGANFNYDLLWVIWMASGMGMLFQYMSGKLGLAGYSLPELMRMKLKNKRAVLAYWLLSELIILATDLAEFLGIVVALKLLFGIPMLFGTFIAVLDILLILVFTQKRLRYLEMAFVVFVAIIGLAFLYEVVVSKPDMMSIVKGSFLVKLTAESALVAVGIIGATVMPHAIFVHSWLIKNKSHSIDFKNDEKKLFYHMTEDVLSMGIAALINAAMLIMSAAVFYGLGDRVATLEGAYITLSPLFGSFASFVFAIALLAAGISSSITGALSGQAVMDGLTDFNVPLWVRRLITRVINVIPLTIAILIGIEPLNVLVYSQVILSLLLPLPLIPLLIFTSDKKIMGELVNRKATSAIAVLFSAVIIAFNAYLIFHTISGNIS